MNLIKKYLRFMINQNMKIFILMNIEMERVNKILTMGICSKKDHF